jgi:hypothetical protein
MGLSKLPEGAKGAHDMAVAALGMIQTTDQRKTTPEQFRAQWKDYYTEGLGHDRNPERAGFFNGDESKTWTEELRYLNSKIQPVADVRNAAAKGAEADMKAIRDSIAEFTARMKAEAERLKNGPPPPSGGFPGDPGHRTLKSLEVPSDSLTKVGNFLGGSQGAIMRLAEQRTQYLRRIAMGIDRLSGGQRPRGSSLGNPNAVFIPLH